MFSVSTQIETPLSLDSGVLHVPDLSPWATTRMAGFLDLPVELFNMIARLLTKKDLLKLRSVGNRRIRDGIEHTWAKLSFAERRCRTTVVSIEHLKTIACSRFAKYVNSIKIDIHFQIRSAELRSYYAENVECAAEQCMGTNVGAMSLGTELTAIFCKIGSLRRLTIGAPPARGTLSNDLLQYTCHTTCGSCSWLEFTPLINSAHAQHPVICLPCARLLITSIMLAMQASDHRLDDFRTVDFALSLRESSLVKTIPLLNTLAKFPAVDRLTRLELDLGMFTNASNHAILTVVKLIEKNAHLQHLKLCTTLRPHTSFEKLNENWGPLLDVLGQNPPFRLRQLHLDGLITSGTTTLDHIIRTHSSTLRQVLLDHISFRLPNSLRSFFLALAEADIEYVAMRDFWLHDRYYLCGAYLDYYFLEDDELHWSDTGTVRKDETYRNWIDIDLEPFSHDTPMQWDRRDGRYDKAWMRKSMMSVVQMIDWGGIQDMGNVKISC